ncbi:hypothetical protein [Flavobacterium sp. 140616W15]|uniref:hypothetical protein n=1 Tax=Flavobacterium sp. 140616W15 TaxID=2478552 RepID=UPI000F0CFB87|nr:hypothetical protein [Flavobacterium sp. 140616W15]AYN03816.1 hypothetical protein EAG11_06190 [Flavobacterium sp. 140616W15]
MKITHYINTYESVKNRMSLLKKIGLITILSLIGFVSNAQTGIGTHMPDSSAKLDIVATDKGVLLPKVTLKGETDQLSIAGGKAATSLLVYNTGLEPDFPIKGFMFWNGSRWRLLTDVTTIKAKIEGVLISKSAVLIPNSYTAGVDYNGVLEIMYNGGNGGYYSEGESYEYNGLHFTLQAGQATSTGKLIYIVTGKPKVSNPTSIDNVPIRFSNDILGHMNIEGTNTTSIAQYTLHKSIVISQNLTGENIGANNGYGGTKLEWRKDDNTKIQSIKLPETGAYVFSFRLYGPVSGTSPNAAPFYISALKQGGEAPLDRPTDTLLDIAELTLVKPNNYSNYTYSINLTAAGQAGDLIYFKMSGAKGTLLTWSLSNGSDGIDYNTLANRTSMIFWKL